MRLVDSQQARRILDRLVGYKLSPFLWKKVVRGLSAGRVQSVAVRIVVDREREIEKFKSQEYWSIEATLSPQDGSAHSTSTKQADSPPEKSGTFTAQLHSKDGKSLEKLAISSQEETESIKKELTDARWQVERVERKEKHRNPLPPFTTSTLQQESWQRLRYSAKRTMMLAQNLYERGLITYHRTDSLTVAESALLDTQKFSVQKYGREFSAGAPRRFKTKSKGAQEAHEAIRPSYPDRLPQTTKLEAPQKKLYDLIWSRFIASQMAPAVFDATTVDVATATPYTFRANGSTLKF